MLSIHLGDHGVSEPLRYWVNSGLMTFFFFVVGLEARREFDMGELRERRRLALPVAAGLCGMLVPVVIYVAVNAGSPHTHGFGVAMSTDTAFALGMLALVGPRFPDRLRAFMLTVAVVDDIVALVVIGTVYTTDFKVVPLLVAAGAARRRRDRGAEGRALRARLRGARRRRLARDDEVGDRSGRRRPGDGADDLRLAGRPRRPRARHRPLPALPRAADARARTERVDRRCRRRSRPTSGSRSCSTRGRAT